MGKMEPRLWRSCRLMAFTALYAGVTDGRHGDGKRNVSIPGAWPAYRRPRTIAEMMIWALYLVKSSSCDSCRYGSRWIIEGVHAMIPKRERLISILGSNRGGQPRGLVCYRQGAPAAIRAAVATNWPNGQTKGQTTKLKFIKRQMYGREKCDLLEGRLIGGS